jgi:ankyrin repeat protein
MLFSSLPAITRRSTEEALMENLDAFFTAIKNGDLAEVEKMLRENPALTEGRTDDGVSPIMLAMYYGEPEIARYISSLGTPVNIFEAAATGNIDQVAELIHGDATQVNAYAADGFQPLGLAAFFGHLAVVELLLIQGAEVNSASKNDLCVMPLHSAAASQHLEIAQALLEQGADPNTRQAGDFTPIHSAAQNGQLEMIHLLLEYGADLNAKSAKGQTPLMIALEKGHSEAIELLRERGAQ